MPLRFTGYGFTATACTRSYVCGVIWWLRYTVNGSLHSAFKVLFSMPALFHSHTPEALVGFRSRSFVPNKAYRMLFVVGRPDSPRAALPPTRSTARVHTREERVSIVRLFSPRLRPRRPRRPPHRYPRRHRRRRPRAAHRRPRDRPRDRPRCGPRCPPRPPRRLPPGPPPPPWPPRRPAPPPPAWAQIGR